jgi:hypothetical protein
VDCGRLASFETADELRQLWSDKERLEKLIDGMASDDRGLKGAHKRAEDLLALFLEGFDQEAQNN